MPDVAVVNPHEHVKQPRLGELACRGLEDAMHRWRRQGVDVDKLAAEIPPE